MSDKLIPEEVVYQSTTLSLRELYEQLITKKPDLEARGYDCPWILKDIGTGQPVMLKGFVDGVEGTLIMPNIRKVDGRLRFDVTLSYDPAKDQGYCHGDVRVAGDITLYRSLQSAILGFNEVTGLDLKIQQSE